MYLSKNQKIVTAIGLLLLVISFIFPPWSDFAPDLRINEERNIGLIGYSFILNPPDHYQFQDYYVTKYTDTQQTMINIQKSWRDKRKYKVKSLSEKYIDLKYFNKSESLQNKLKLLYKFYRKASPNPFDKVRYKIDEEERLLKIDPSKLFKEDTTLIIDNNDFVEINKILDDSFSMAGLTKNQYRSLTYYFENFMDSLFYTDYYSLEIAGKKVKVHKSLNGFPNIDFRMLIIQIFIIIFIIIGTNLILKK